MEQITNLTLNQAEDLIINCILANVNNAEIESVRQEVEINYIRQIIRVFKLHKLFLEINSSVSTELAIAIIINNVKNLITKDYINQYSYYLSFCLIYEFLLYSLDNILCIILCLEINSIFRQNLKVKLDFTRSYRHSLCLQVNLNLAYQYADGSEFEETILQLKHKLFKEENISEWWELKGKFWTEELISITIRVRDCYQFQLRHILQYKQQLSLINSLSKTISNNQK